MKTTFANTLAVFATAGALLLTACAAPRPADPTPKDVVGGMKSEDAKSAECVTASIVGGLLGGMMAEENSTAKGTAIGAGIGMLGCVAVKANARTSPSAPAPTPATATSAAK